MSQFTAEDSDSTSPRGDDTSQPLPIAEGIFFIGKSVLWVYGIIAFGVLGLIVLIALLIGHILYNVR